jgi:hypothetical protein
MRRVLKSIDVREGLFAHDVVLAKPAAGTGYCGSEIVTALEPMEGGGLQFCDYVRTCTKHPDGTTEYEHTLIEGSCTGNILETGPAVAQ